MIVHNKRGISNIVASVLIILLAIMGVSLIGYLIYKLINGTTGTAECNSRSKTRRFFFAFQPAKWIARAGTWTGNGFGAVFG